MARRAPWFAPGIALCVAGALYLRVRARRARANRVFGPMRRGKPFGEERAAVVVTGGGGGASGDGSLVAYRLLRGESAATGCGRIVLCLHGLTGDSRAFADLAAALVERGGAGVAAVAVVDLPGHGRSPCVADGWDDGAVADVDAELRAVVADVEAALGGGAPARSVVAIGFSMGALRATRFAVSCLRTEAAATAAVALDALVLLCPAALSPPPASAAEHALVRSPLFRVVWWLVGARFVAAWQRCDFAAALASTDAPTRRRAEALAE